MRLFTAFAATLILILSACQKVPPEDMSALELRTYDVPKGTVRPLRSAIKDALWLNENQKNVGRAVVTPDGRLAVLATRNVQAGVKALVDEVAKNPPTLEQTIELRYWLLVGHPAPAAQPPPAELAEIQPALTEISRSQGPQTFSVVQRVRLSSLNDERARVAAGQQRQGRDSGAPGGRPDCRPWRHGRARGRCIRRGHALLHRSPCPAHRRWPASVRAWTGLLWSGCT
jgi:hypothetical protein